jgi:hypothetical protein
MIEIGTPRRGAELARHARVEKREPGPQARARKRGDEKLHPASDRLSYESSGSSGDGDFGSVGHGGLTRFFPRVGPRRAVR